MYIANPFKGKGRSLRNLSSTHPPLDERIKILRNMTGAGLSDYDEAYKKTTGRPVGTIPASALKSSETSSIIEVPGTEIGLVSATAAQNTHEEFIKLESADGKQSPDRGHIQRTRETTDALWKLNDYKFIECDCDTNLKIPPIYSNKVIDCPHCLKSHRVAHI